MGRATGRNVVLVKSGTNTQIRQFLQDSVPEAIRQCKKIAHLFKGDDTTETCRNIWNYLKNSLKYQPDGYIYQDIRLPNRLVDSGAGDCKSFSLFTAGVLGALNIPFTFRYAAYDGLKTPSHVYIVGRDKSGKNVIIDGVFDQFNRQKEPYIGYDVKTTSMQIRQLQGINGNYDETQIIDGWFKDAVKKVGKAIGNAVKKTGEAVKKVGLAPARGAFLLLVAWNFRGWATALSQNTSNDWNRLMAKWSKLGGSKNELAKIIKNGARRKRIFGTENAHKILINGRVCLDPATASAALSAAGAIFAALAEFMKSRNQTPTSDESGPFDQDDVFDNEFNDMPPDISTTGGGGATTQTPDTGGTSWEWPTQNPSNNTGGSVPAGSGLQINNKTILIGAAIAAGLYMYNRRLKKNGKT